MESAGKFCFVGAGFHATTNIYPSFIESKGIISAISTRNIQRSKEALIRLGSFNENNGYDDYKKMIVTEMNIDGVVVIAQPTDQSGIVLDCLKAHKNVFVDKPCGMNSIQAAELAQVAKENNVILMVGFMKRFAPIYVKLKEMIDSKELGDIINSLI